MFREPSSSPGTTGRKLGGQDNTRKGQSTPQGGVFGVKRLGGMIHYSSERVSAWGGV